MSGFLSKVGHFLGHNLSEASHAAGFIPGIGPIVGGAMRAAGGLIEGDGLHDSLKNAAVEGIKNYGLGKIASAIPGVSSAESAISSKLGGIPGVQGIQSAMHSAPGIPGVQGIQDFLTGNGGKNALGLAQGVNAALLQKKSNEFANNAMGSVQSDYDSRAPLRQAGQAAMLNPGQGIAAKIAGLPNFNPYSQHAPAAPPASAPAIGGHTLAPQIGPAVPPRAA
jgi:hypothetical protein